MSLPQTSNAPETGILYPPIIIEGDRWNFNRAILDFAEQFIGQQETQKNMGFKDKAFQQLMEEAGWLPGEAWCASLTKMVWMNVYRQTEWFVEIQRVLSKSVLASWNNAKASKILKVSSAPVEGGIILWGTGNGKGHCGIIESIKDEFNVVTIEGNTTRSGTREGDQVMRKNRKLQPTGKWNRDWNYLGIILPPPYAYIPTEHPVESTTDH